MAQNEVWLLIGLFAVSIPLVAVARRANVAYPILLVLGGVALGYIPGVPIPHLDPNVVLYIFLPPLLYWQSVTAPIDVMRANAMQIWLLAIGLVLATTLAVGAAVHATIHDFTWPMAFLLGAILSPTDELASAPVLENMKMPRHLVAIVQGESLMNDSAGLIVYGFAVAAVVTGAFSFSHAMLEFVISTAGAVLVGIVLARVAAEAWRLAGDPQLQGVISFLLPFAAYLVASKFSVSGVLAVVAAAFTASRLSPRLLTPAARIQGAGYWETTVFLANALLYLMIGMQVPSLVAHVLQRHSWQSVLLYAGIVNAALLVTRFVWILAQEYIPLFGATSEHERPDWKHALIAGWSGLRGAVSLAAALAIPVAIGGGRALPDRDLIILLTFSVILLTLVAGGLTLPFVVKRLHVGSGGEEAQEDVRRAVVTMSETALAELRKIEGEGNLPREHITRLRRRYQARRQYIEEPPEEAEAVFEAERRLLNAQRDALLSLRDRREIDNTVLREMQRMLDVSEERLERQTP